MALNRKSVISAGKSRKPNLSNGDSRRGQERRSDLEALSNVTPLTKTGLVYGDLRSLILSGELKPGSRLVIRRIAEKHNVSDIPVREALRLLEKDGLIRYLPYGSAFVRQANDNEIYELYFIRGLLEGAATQLSVNFMTEMTLRKLSSLCEAMEKCTSRKDIAGYSQLNREFHRTVFHVLPFPKLTDQIENFWQTYGWLQLTFRLRPSRMAESDTEHRAILNALRSGSVAEAGRAAFDHKQNARRAFIAARKITKGKQSDKEPDASAAETIEALCEFWGEIQSPNSMFSMLKDFRAARGEQASLGSMRKVARKPKS